MLTHDHADNSSLFDF